MAKRAGRRSVLHWVGTAAVGGAMVPMLPFNRAGMGTARAQAEKTDVECEYWRYCALDGFLCTCCGGSVTSCPSNAQVSKVTWVGTCQNPADSKEYLISYNDCCGVPSCGKCLSNSICASVQDTGWASITTSTGVWPMKVPTTIARSRPWSGWAKAAASAASIAFPLLMPATSALADGQALFEGKCAACHKKDGMGVPGLAPPLAGAPWATADKAREYVPWWSEWPFREIGLRRQDLCQRDASAKAVEGCRDRRGRELRASDADKGQGAALNEGDVTAKRGEKIDHKALLALRTEMVPSQPCGPRVLPS